MKAFLEAQGYTYVRQLPNGEWAGLIPLIYTTGLCVGFDKYGWTRRFCYEKKIDAVSALQVWDGEGEAPGPWVAKRG